MPVHRAVARLGWSLGRVGDPDQLRELLVAVAGHEEADRLTEVASEPRVRLAAEMLVGDEQDVVLAERSHEGPHSRLVEWRRDIEPGDRGAKGTVHRCDAHDQVL